MTPDPRITFGLSCPTGGEFRICQNTSTRFIGCCSVDPCTPTRGGQCPETELFEASFSASAGVNLVPQGCATSGTWYTCPDARPPFLGCCTRDPCDKGCGTDHLVPATLSDNDVYASQLMIPEPDSDGNGGARTWMIVGVTAVGVLVFLLVFIGLSLWMKRRDRKTETRRGRTTVRGSPASPASADAVALGPLVGEGAARSESLSPDSRYSGPRVPALPTFGSS